MFLAVVRAPEVPDVVDRAAAAAGLVRADAQRRLAGTLPRVLLVGEAPALDTARAALEAAGFRAVAFDPRLAPGDDERTLARGLELHDRELVVIAGTGAEIRQRVPLDAIGLMQRAMRASVSRRTVVAKQRRLALGAAILTGGLKTTKQVEHEVTETRETREALLVVQRRDGGDDIVLSEQRLDYRFLGAGLQPSSHANFEATVERLRRAAPGARYDDRAARPGFVNAIPACSADPLDVALYLVQLAVAIDAG